ncbi:MAG: lipopolysaccharide biosynthesis protein [Dysgonamonadaceae bacterium]|jgi:uncharacterized protein involved in exopolysaccharide biosynthesis|nr:lipopolysaccharide biosynthesis protein [Dysgonamonadaceae bacterium]
MDNLDSNRINQEQEIDLKNIIKRLWKNRKFILVIIAISLLLGVFVAYTSPISYTANITVVQQTGQGSGSLGDFFSMIGMNLGASLSGDILSPTIYPRIVSSVPFCKEIMATPIVVEKSKGVPITLYEYYTNERYQTRSLLNDIKRYTIGLPGVILSIIRPSSSPYTADTCKINGIIALTASERDVLEIIRENMRIENNNRDGYITLSYSFSDPKAASVITQQIYSELEKNIKNFKVQKQIDNLEFVEVSYEEARRNFLQIHAELAAFQDANRLLSTAKARAEERLLNSEYDIAFTVYNELARLLEQARLAVKEATPVLTVIEPVVVPHERSAPRRGVILVAFLFLGLIVSSGWILVKPFLENIVREVREDSDEE